MSDIGGPVDLLSHRRGIEFGDEKAQQWLWSLLSGFFSSILFLQPLKVDFLWTVVTGSI
jgi:hypothetical protein